MSNIVKDSSIWMDRALQKATAQKDAYLRVGIVKRVHVDKNAELRYLVEIRSMGRPIDVSARQLRKFGGVYNYEDVVLRDYNINQAGDQVEDFAAKAGDVVLVGFLDGESRYPIILGMLSHPARKSTISHTDGPIYQSEFNGVEKSINKDGEYTLTFKGVPTNIDQLSKAPKGQIAPPKYNTDIGSTYLKFDKTGSVEISDNSKKKVQRVKIDKSTGQILIDSGQVSIKMSKDSETIETKSKILKITSDDLIDQKTKTYKVDAGTSASIKSPKVAFGKEGVELLDQLAKLIDALGKVQPISPVGPCTAIKATPQWPQVEEIKAKIKEITGSLG